MPAPKAKTAYQYKTVGDKRVRPVLFDGKNQNLGKFMAGEYEGNGGLVLGRDGRIKKYAEI